MIILIVKTLLYHRNISNIYRIRHYEEKINIIIFQFEFSHMLLSDIYFKISDSSKTKDSKMT